MRIGSLFSGAGGLDLAVEHVFGAETAWHCEIDPAASKVLEQRWPGVPNHQDITLTDWANVEPADIICGGWPCQPFSLAGKRKGAADERALWPYVADTVRMVRPRIVVLENVSAVLGPEFSRVANDLAALGYEFSWTCLRASDVGAPHRRERLFVVAYTSGAAVAPQSFTEPWCGDTPLAGQHHRTTTHAKGERRSRGDEPQPHVVHDGSQPAHTSTHGRVASDSACDGRHQRRPQPTRLQRGSDAPLSGHRPVDLLPTPQTSDTNGAGAHGDGSLDLRTAVTDLLPTPSVADGMGGHMNRSGDRKSELLLPGIAKENAWGKYAPAITRWETLTRAAPPPTEPNRNNKPRLNPAFSEWMMGWPAGWVTDIGISCNDQLRIIGNGVVPQQATAALQWLLQTIQAAA